MKAVICSQYGPPEVLRVVELEKPVPKDNEVLIKVHATTVTVADSRVRGFRVPAPFWLPARLALGLTKPRKAVLGVELAGTIESTGKNAQRFKKGDQVFAATLTDFGAYAEYVCLRESGPIAMKPANITFEEAAAIPIGARTAQHYLRKVGISPGKQIMIYGASGSVGTYAVQLARYYGAEVTAVCSQANFALVKSLGANKVIDYKSENFARELEMYDIVFLAVDNCPFPIANKHLKADGVYANITAPLKSPSMLWTSLTTKKKILTGENSPESAADLESLKVLVESGKLKPVIDRVYTLEEIVEAHRYVDAGHKKGNVVVKI